MSALLALFCRSLRDDVRSKSTYWLRAGFVALMLLFMQGSFSLTQWVGAPGLHVFSRVLWMNVFFVSIAGLSYFASAITEEKEEGTLSLLRMTDLDPLAILLGKSTGRVAGSLLLLTVQLPFTILATSLGGVNLTQVLAAYATLASYLFFLSNLALVFSVLCRRTSRAATLTGLSLVLFFWLPGWIAVWRGIALSMVALDYDTTSTALEKLLFWWWRASPLVRVEQILQTGFHDTPVGWQVGSDLILGMACFGLAWMLFDRCADRAVEGASLAGGSGVRPLRRATARRGRPWRNPLVWKDYYYVAGGVLGIAIKMGVCATILGLMIWGWIYNQGDFASFGFTTMVVMTLFWAADLGICASRLFRVELRGQTLSGLAGLPLSFAQVARQKTFGCVLSTWPELLFFLGGLALAAPEILNGLEKKWVPFPAVFFIVACTAAGIAFFVNLTAWLSLRVKFGALPLAVVISFVGAQILPLACAFAFSLLKFLAPGDTSELLVYLMLTFALTVTLISTTALLISLPRRLEQLAAEA